MNKTDRAKLTAKLTPVKTKMASKKTVNVTLKTDFHNEPWTHLRKKINKHQNMTNLGACSSANSIWLFDS